MRVSGEVTLRAEVGRVGEGLKVVGDGAAATVTAAVVAATAVDGLERNSAAEMAGVVLRAAAKAAAGEALRAEAAAADGVVPETTGAETTGVAPRAAGRAETVGTHRKTKRTTSIRKEELAGKLPAARFTPTLTLTLICTLKGMLPIGRSRSNPNMWTGTTTITPHLLLPP
jgi:hypothetical protein